METETFYAVTLEEKDRSIAFDLNEAVVEEKLQIKQIVLGITTDTGYHVVEAETEDVTIPIAVLKMGETSVLKPNIEFPNTAVTFKLIQGKGPVYIHGQHIICEDEEQEGAVEAEDEPEQEQEKTNGKRAPKRKMPN